ncbi:hypothetical protein N9J50_01770 [Methylophilaceae bacterium]|nr:hypothetical protein [Methylophilaceae bacterium]
MFVGIGANSAGGDYNLENSLRFRYDASARLIRSPSTSSNRKTWTLSFWIKRGRTGTGTGANLTTFYSVQNGLSRDIFRFYLDKMELSLNNGTSGALTTTQLFRDISSWYHIVVAVDTTNATANNRIRLYINGEEVTSFSLRTNPSLNYDTYTNSTLSHRFAEDYGYYSDFYLTEANLIDGQQLTPSDFGDYNSDTGVWQPKEYTGTYGTNGYYLNGSTSGTTVLDESSNSNNWDSNNMNLTNSALTTYDIMTDVPTLTDEDTANYAVMNPLDLASTSTEMSNGNLKVSHTGAVWNADRATMGVSSGKWYWEVIVSVVGYTFAGGVMKTELAILNNTFPGNGSYPSGSSFGYYFTGSKYGGGLNNAAYGASYTNGDTIGTALDLDAGTITFYKNGVSQGVAFTGLSGEFAPSTGLYNTANHLVNFGQQPFRYTPPTGHLKLNTFNLPDSSIVDGSENMNAVLYTGNGTGQSITGVGFQPDLVWIKSRSDVDNNILQDAVRGVTRQLFSNNTNAETNYTNGVTSFNADGFTVATSNWSNENGQTRVAWNWKANGTGVSNTAGTVTTQVSANPTAGFSIVKWTGTASGTTMGHGLGAAPKVIISKPTSTTGAWHSYFSEIPNMNNGYITLDTDNAFATGIVIWGGSPNTTTFTQVKSAYANLTGQTYIAYCFAEVEGYSKFGSYTGNGSADGPFIYTGFRPAFVMMKATSAVAGNWAIYDVKREVYNIADNLLFANLTNAEAVAQSKIDILSNGFKCRSTNSNSNSNNAPYIYMAFAENPFKNSLAR